MMKKIQKYDLKFSLASQASSVKETWASFWRTGMPMACRRMARLQVGELHNWGYSHNFSLSLSLSPHCHLVKFRPKAINVHLQ